MNKVVKSIDMLIEALQETEGCEKMVITYEHPEDNKAFNPVVKLKGITEIEKNLYLITVAHGCGINNDCTTDTYLCEVLDCGELEFADIRGNVVLKCTGIYLPSISVVGKEERAKITSYLKGELAYPGFENYSKYGNVLLSDGIAYKLEAGELKTYVA